MCSRPRTFHLRPGFMHGLPRRRGQILGCVLGLVLALPPPAVAQAIALPDIGDPSQQYLDIGDEHRIGLALMRQLRERNLVLDDVQLTEYLSAVGQRIALNAEDAVHPFTFFWVRNPEINAFALPGGFIGVNTGLLLATRSESELAGVLAHEIAHVNQHHITRAYADAERMALPTMAAMLAGIAVAAASRGSQVGSAAVAGTMAASAQHSINFTRANEQEADRVGTSLLLRSGYDPNAMTDFFGRFDKLTGSAAQIPEFLRTHPLTINRMADTQSRTGGRASARGDRDERGYRFARARADVLSNDNTGQLIRMFEERLAKSAAADDADRYGYVLALARAARYEDAVRQLEMLMKTRPDLLALRIEEAELALASGDADRAWRLYERLRRLYPNDFTLTMRYAQALTRRGDPRQAAQLLQAQLRHRPDMPELHALYAQAAERSGDQAATHLAMTEYYYLTGAVRAAIVQAEIGLRDPAATPVQLAQLRKRLLQLKSMTDLDKLDR